MNITLNAVGPVTLTGGSGSGSFAGIGTFGASDANVIVNSQAGIALNRGAGPGANALIGSTTGSGIVNVNAGRDLAAGTAP